MKYFQVLVMLFCCLVGYADAHDLYSFDSPQKKQRFINLTNELRCLVCQNESLADSNAGLAKDLRAEIYQQIQQGADEASIRNFLLARYGQFILFKPAMNNLTIFLWLFPFLLLLVGALIYVFIAYQGRKAQGDHV